MRRSSYFKQPGYTAFPKRLAATVLAIALSITVNTSSVSRGADVFDPFSTVAPTAPQLQDPFESPIPVQESTPGEDPFDQVAQAPPPTVQRDGKALQPTTMPASTATANSQPTAKSRPVNFQMAPTLLPAPISSPTGTSEPGAGAAANSNALGTNSDADETKPTLPLDPCGRAAEKPLFALGIEIGTPSGQMPTDHAAACWESINATGPAACARCWTPTSYQWDATCLAHRPLYFEEINLERYGYGCGWCLQPAASAAHFFGAVPALPYCMAVDCPYECVYTLGHYRPGSCPPWRHHWPPCDPLAASSEVGVLTGLIFLIP